MSDPLKYAVIERERRFLVAQLPEGDHETWEIADRYVTGTRLRLREVTKLDGTVLRKLGHKVRLSAGPEEIACTSLYLDDDEWALLVTLPGTVLRKRRHFVMRDGLTVAVDEHQDGTLVAEIDDRDQAPTAVPAWLAVVAEVTHDEAWTGVRLSR